MGEGGGEVLLSGPGEQLHQQLNGVVMLHEALLWCVCVCVCVCVSVCECV